MSSLTTRVRRSLHRTVLVPMSAKHALAQRGFPLTANERRFLALRDRYQGRRCVIVGGGPSLKKTNLGLLAGEVTFCVNGFYHLLPDAGFTPTFYVVEDRLVAEDNADALNDLKGTTKIFPEDLRYRLRGGDDTIFVAFDRYYEDPDNPSPAWPRFADHRREPGASRFYWGGTVSYLNLQLAYYMGFSLVVLIGMDLSYAAPTTGVAHVMTSTGDDPNHVHPAWFGAGKRWHDPQVDRMARAFARARDVFERDGRHVVNATVGGRLEVYERVPLEAALAPERTVTRDCC